MRYTVVLVALLGLTVAPLQAQDVEWPERPVVSISFLGGGFSPLSEFDDGSRFETGGTVGGALTVWPIRHLGIRGTLLRTRNDVYAPTATRLMDEDPEVWYAGGDLMARLSVDPLARWGWYPYLFGGLGAKRYEFDLTSSLDDTTDFAASVGAGLEYRVGRVGVHAEARSVFSSFERLQYTGDQRDLVYAAGFSVNL